MDVIEWWTRVDVIVSASHVEQSSSHISLKYSLTNSSMAIEHEPIELEDPPSKSPVKEHFDFSAQFDKEEKFLKQKLNLSWSESRSCCYCYTVMCALCDYFTRSNILLALYTFLFIHLKLHFKKETVMLTLSMLTKGQNFSFFQ